MGSGEAKGRNENCDHRRLKLQVIAISLVWKISEWWRRLRDA
jgi:hypothetical protein